MRSSGGSDPLVLVFLAALFWAGCEKSAEIPAPVATSLAGREQAKIETARAHLMSSRGSGKAWGEYGMVLRAFGFHAQAQRCFEQAEKLDDRDPRWPYFLARSPHGIGPEESMDWLRRAVALCGNDPVAVRYHLAKALVEEHLWAEAETEIQALCGSHPGYGPAALLQARVEMARTNLAAADQWLEKCSNDPSSRKAAAALRAQLQQQRGDQESAKIAARRAAALPADEPVHDVFEASVQALKVDAADLSAQAHQLLAARDLTNAARVISILESKHAEVAETWLLLGRLRFLQADRQGAEKALRRHLAKEPESLQGLFQLGMVQLSLNQFEAAAATFTSALRLKPDFGPAWFNQGLAMARAGKLREAIEPFQEAIRCNPEYLESYVMLAEIHLQLMEPEKAGKWIGQALSIHPEHPRARALEQKLRRMKQP